MALVNRPVILRQMLAAKDEEAGGNSPMTVFKPVKMRQLNTKLSLK